MRKHMACAQIGALAARDPFVTGGVATVEVIAFDATMTAPGFETLATRRS